MTTLNYGFIRLNKGTHMLEMTYKNGLRYAKMYPITKKEETTATIEEELEVPQFMHTKEAI